MLELLQRRQQSRNGWLSHHVHRVGWGDLLAHRCLKMLQRSQAVLRHEDEADHASLQGQHHSLGL